eukprot:1144988-Pelagomonas_calceolata.AAC.2
MAAAWDNEAMLKPLLLNARALAVKCCSFILLRCGLGVYYCAEHPPIFHKPKGTITMTYSLSHPDHHP